MLLQFTKEKVRKVTFFLVTTFGTILMHLIYMDKYSLIDSSMSDSQVGGRKECEKSYMGIKWNYM